MRVYILHVKPKPERGNTAFVHKVRHDAPGLVDGYGKADTFATGVYCGIDAYKHTLEIQQGAAAVAGVDGGISLDEVGKSAVAAADGAPQGRNDACGHRMAEAERIADGDGCFAGQDVVRVAQAHRGQVAGPFDLQHGYVEIRVRAANGGGEFAAVQQAHHNFIAARDNVGVSEHKAFLAVHNNARAKAFAFLLAGRARAAKARPAARPEELFQRRKGLPLDYLRAGDIDYCRRSRLNCAYNRRHARAAFLRGRSCRERGQSEQPA